MPRFKWSKMCVTKEKGELDLQDVRLYSFWFEIAMIVNHWRRMVSGLIWANMEKNLSVPFHPINVLSQCLKDKEEDINPVKILIKLQSHATDKESLKGLYYVKCQSHRSVVSQLLWSP